MKPIILASSSTIRAHILQSARVDFEVVSPGVDEEPIKAAARAERLEPAAMARRLAEAKALAVSAKRPEAVVIGADQLLEFDGVIFDKPISLADAEARLRAMRGRAHHLVGAVVLAEGSAVVDVHLSISKLKMRAFSDEALADHMARGGEDLLKSVGAYRFEAEGAHLFDVIDGDYYGILGLPLLPTLAMLRRAEALKT